MMMILMMMILMTLMMMGVLCDIRDRYESIKVLMIRAVTVKQY